MSAPLRFLAVAVLGWAGIRAATLGVIPGAEAFTVARAQPAARMPVLQSEIPSYPPTEQEWAQYPEFAGYAPQEPVASPHYVAVPVYYPVPAAPPTQPAPVAHAAYAPAFTPILPEPAPQFYAEIPELDEWPLSRIASTAISDRRSANPVPLAGLIPRKHLDRLQLSAWALLRGRPGTGALASGGTLGGSQAGARLTYNLDDRFALSLRSSSPVGGSSGGEVAAGVRLTPFRSLPIALTAERRQAIGRQGGRSAFALFLEGGVYHRPLPWNFSLDAYAQAGIVGARRRDLFADGGLAVLRPVYGPVSAGLGIWGGTQPGLHRLDAGPRLSMRVRRNMRIDLDWRQRLAGTANPGSGPAVTLAADF